MKRRLQRRMKMMAGVKMGQEEDYSGMRGIKNILKGRMRMSGMKRGL